MVNIKKNPDLGMLVLRLVVGGAFIAHGWFHFSHMAETVAFFHTVGFAALVAYFVSAVELFGGLALVLGLWTDTAALLIACVMVVAMFYVKIGKFHMGFFTPGSWELDLALLAACVAIMFVGPGKPVAMRRMR